MHQLSLLTYLLTYRRTETEDLDGLHIVGYGFPLYNVYLYICLFVALDSLQDYCGYERFNARCSADHVINVRRALYGRMQPGRCITGDYGHVMGCFADVTSYVSDTCDYRQNCTLLVATMDSVAQPCAKDFKSYLQAYYVCVRGIGL